LSLMLPVSPLSEAADGITHVAIKEGGDGALSLSPALQVTVVELGVDHGRGPPGRAARVPLWRPNLVVGAALQ
jgi:hypothetical protein